MIKYKCIAFWVRLMIVVVMLGCTQGASAQMRKMVKKMVGDAMMMNERGFVTINGIEQWITIKGDVTKPAILFLHGGPGSPMSPYSDTLYKDWIHDFLIVQWDQRGTGKTFGVTAPAELTPAYLHANPLTVEQMTADGIAVVGYLLQHLRKQKVILTGTSWGSVLGVKMATARPELFYAYVGHSQVVNIADDLPLYNKAYALAINTGDTASIAVLDAIGKPPYDMARKVGQLFKIVKKYERANSTPAPAWWFKEATEYDNPKDAQNREDGDDYSFANFVGDSKLGVVGMRPTINFLRDNLVFKTPIYLIQGEEDMLTPKESSKNYFDHLQAPLKKYYLLPKAAHGFNETVLKTQWEICKGLKVK